MSYTPSADRSTWPAEARAIAEDPKLKLPDHAVFYMDYVWPNPDAWIGALKLPRVRYGDTEMWVPVRVHTGGRPDHVWVFAQKIPRKPPRNLECKLSTEVDETEAVA